MAGSFKTPGHDTGDPVWPVFALLVPVVVLAALAGVAVARDWRSAQGEASARGQELVTEVAARLTPRFDPGNPGREGSSSAMRQPLAGFVIGVSNQLLEPAPGRWPPDPQPLPPLSDPSRQALWDLAHNVHAPADTSSAVHHLEAFLHPPPSETPPTRDAKEAREPGESRHQRLALFERALALERTGSTLDPIEAFQQVLGRFPWSGSEARTEAGLAVGNLAALRIADLANGDAGLLPEDWRSNARHLADAFDHWPPSPFLSALAERLEALARSPAGQTLWEHPEQASEPIRMAETRRQRHAAALKRLGSNSPWPEAFWITDETPAWLAFQVPSQSPDPNPSPADHRTFFLLHQAWLEDGIQSTLSILDRRGDFSVRLRVGGRDLRLGGDTARLWKRQEELASLRQTLSGGFDLEVAVGLADPEAYYASQRQRLGWFGGIVGLAALAAVISTWATRRALIRQRQWNRDKSNFVSSVSHELRAPLGSIRLLAEGLERGTVTTEVHRQEYFRLIGQETRRLGALVENVLDYSRIEQGRKRYDLQPTHIASVVRDSVRVTQRSAAGKEISIALSEVPPASPDENGSAVDDERRWEVTVDGRAIQQALLNLIDNAMKHAPAGSEILVSLVFDPDSSISHPARTCRISVRDQGPGIPEADHERIFEPFFRRGSELRRETEGVGIGLSIVRHIAEAHGGVVEVDSSPGRGACFTLVLPGPETTPTPGSSSAAQPASLVPPSPDLP